MTITSDLSLVDDYVLRCAPFLSDLAPDLCAQLQEDIRQIVGEVTSELDGLPDDLVGPPERFVTELRLAAGVSSTEPAASPEPTPVSVVRDAVSEWFSAAAWPWVRELTSDLRPAWWVARGVGVAFVLGHITGGAEQGTGIVPDVLRSNVLGLLAVLGFVFASVERGRQRGRRSRGRTAMWVVASVIGLVGIGIGIDQVRYPSGGYENFAQPAVIDIPIAADRPIAAELSGQIEAIAPRYLSLYIGDSGNQEPFAEGVTSYAHAREVLAELQTDDYAASELRLELHDGFGGEFHSSLSYRELDALAYAFFIPEG